jgi:hypothetical protein
VGRIRPKEMLVTSRFGQDMFNYLYQNGRYRTTY